MLILKDIKKDYISGNTKVHALKGINLSFRKQEFVSILGQSGCGKTTLLNIIGGLDHYTSGDVIVNGISTKKYKDKDWDTYRNHRIGFVFQSYNLIPHQSVLSNVELALTLSGVSKKERRERATQALTKVGLQDQLHKRPNQMSGGQMQRVAIARALVNDPDILLADEPTGALDSHTSIQIMELLQEIAQEKLVIMVTHNPELAQQYSTRIIRVFDGNVIDDSHPFEAKEETNSQRSQGKDTSMSFQTALSLSCNNLMTKKARTFLTAFAGSIGIIGIALILSLSNGVQNYIDSIEKETLSSYPIQIQDNAMDLSVMMETMIGMQSEEGTEAKETIGTKPMMNDLLNTMSEKMKKNNLAAFKEYIEQDAEFQSYTKAIEYQYPLQMSVYHEGSDAGLVQVSPNHLLDELGLSTMTEMNATFMGSAASNNEVWKKLPDASSLREEEFTLLAGAWPSQYNEVVIAVDRNQEITDFALYSLGIMDQQEVIDNFNAIKNGKTIETSEIKEYTKEDLLGMQFQLINQADLYQKTGNLWISMEDDEDYVKEIVKTKGETIKVVGIIQPSEQASTVSETGAVYYTKALQDRVVEQAKASEIVKQQMQDPEINVFTNTAFDEQEKLDMSNLSMEQKMQFAAMDEKQLAQFMQDYSKNMNATYESNLQTLGAIDFNQPSSISIYANSFEDKENITAKITAYNDQVTQAGRDGDVISYQDIVGMMMESVTNIVDMISYVLMAFVSVSLIVSSIMIGIITYISVLERTKEIGILRAIGASKKDISRVFNAETFMIGLCAGLIGIGVTVALNIPISIIVERVSNVSNVASLPWMGGVILILISLLLTVVAGLIPSKIASKKDPVEALRSE